MVPRDDGIMVCPEAGRGAFERCQAVVAEPALCQRLVDLVAVKLAHQAVWREPQVE